MFNVSTKDIVEFMSILLSPNIDWLSIDLKCWNEALRTVILLFWFLKVGKDLFKMMENIVVKIIIWFFWR
jgi:hypothetical protein